MRNRRFVPTALAGMTLGSRIMLDGSGAPPIVVPLDIPTNLTSPGDPPTDTPTNPTGPDQPGLDIPTNPTSPGDPPTDTPTNPSGPSQPG